MSLWNVKCSFSFIKAIRCRISSKKKQFLRTTKLLNEPLITFGLWSNRSCKWLTNYGLRAIFQKLWTWNVCFIYYSYRSTLSWPFAYFFHCHELTHYIISCKCPTSNNSTFILTIVIQHIDNNLHFMVSENNLKHNVMLGFTWMCTASSLQFYMIRILIPKTKTNISYFFIMNILNKIFFGRMQVTKI